MNRYFLPIFVVALAVGLFMLAVQHDNSAEVQAARADWYIDCQASGFTQIQCSFLATHFTRGSVAEPTL